ncbi:MAG: hypothetical protein Q4C54_08140, partial [Clostridia bacterium]|nr:hypothetical protein [Clostridia bacterium]
GVEAIFEVPGNEKIEALFREKELEWDGCSVTLYREITQSGRNLCRVCGMSMPVSFLKEVAACLMDVHGQHEHQFLMDSKFHMDFLDRSGDAAHQQLLADTASAWEAFMTNHRAY